jgi:hypothetical protein
MTRFRKRMHQRPGESRSSPGRGDDQRRSGLGSRRAVSIAFAISIVLHLVLIALYPTYSETLRPDEANPRLPAEPEEPQGLRLLELVEIATSLDPERPENPEEIEQVEDPDVAPEQVDLEGEPGVTGLAPPPLSGAERLRPRFTDPRLWRPPAASIMDLSDQQREELLLAGRIEEWYDSLAIADEAERRLTDWTFTDDEGKRWGFADGKIYMGDVVLPGTHLFGVPVGKRDEYAQRMWQWDEIERQGARFDVIEAWTARQEAIRERRDRERAARPDTTRGRR